MADFITQHPNFAYILLTLMGGLALYFYRGNENKAAMLIAGKLDMIAEKLDVLFEKDRDRSARISQLETALAKQVQRCDDRAHTCSRKAP